MLVRLRKVDFCYISVFFLILDLELKFYFL